MDDLIAFLRARLDEREFKAKAALPGPWIVEEHTYETVVTSDGGQIVASVDGLRDGWHIADNDPARVLADVAAQRRIVDMYAEARQNAADCREDYTLAGDRPWSTKAEHLDPVVKLLALPHAGHPDYPEPSRRQEPETAKER